jgi:hypothetical protein
MNTHRQMHGMSIHHVSTNSNGTDNILRRKGYMMGMYIKAFHGKRNRKFKERGHNQSHPKDGIAKDDAQSDTNP